MEEITLQLDGFLHTILEKRGSDIYIVPGARVMAKINDQLEPLSESRL